MSWSNLPKLVGRGPDIIDVTDTIQEIGVGHTLAVGDHFRYDTIQNALDSLGEWEGARISITSSYDESKEQFPIVVTGRRNRIILEDQRHESIGSTIDEDVEAVLKFDTGLHKPPGIALYNVHLNGNGHAEHCIKGLSERWTYYENVICRDAKSHGIYHKRNDSGHAMNSHTLIGCYSIAHGGDGYHYEGGAHGVTMYDCTSNENIGYGASLGSLASGVIIAGAHQNNGKAGIYADGHWDFHVFGAYVERITSHNKHHEAEIVVKNHNVVSIQSCYGNGGDQTDYMVKLNGVNNADLKSCLGYRYDSDSLFSFSSCGDVDIHSPSHRYRGEGGGDNIVDSEHFAENVRRPRSNGILGAGCPPMPLPDGNYEGDIGLHPENGLVAWRDDEWAIQGVKD